MFGIRFISCLAAEKGPSATPSGGLNRSLLNRSEEVNDKIKAPNRQETSVDGRENLKARLRTTLSPMIPLFLINPDKLSRNEKNRNYSVKMEKNWVKGRLS
jgi:hypothetical protein